MTSNSLFTPSFIFSFQPNKERCFFYRLLQIFYHLIQFRFENRKQSRYVLTVFLILNTQPLYDGILCSNPFQCTLSLHVSFIYSTSQIFSSHGTVSANKMTDMFSFHTPCWMGLKKICVSINTKKSLILLINFTNKEKILIENMFRFKLTIQQRITAITV